MISMGKSGGVYGSGNAGLPQAFSGGRKTQNNQKSIFGAKNKSSVTDIRRMLARDDRNGQTQVANSWGQDSIVTSTLSYSESLRNQRQQTKNTTLALKKLKYQFKSISSKILRSKTSQAAKQAAGQARREIMRLKRQKQNSDSDSEEIDAAIAHAQAMERVAKKKAKHLEEEEMVKAAGGICQGDRISEEETKDVQDAEAENAQNEEEMSAEGSADEVSGDFSAYEYAGNEAYAGDSYDTSDYIALGMDAFYAQAGDFMSEMSDFTSEMMPRAESARETGSAKKRRRMCRTQRRKTRRMRKKCLRKVLRMKCPGTSLRMSMQAMRRMQGIAMIHLTILLLAWMHSMRRQETLCRK